MVYRRAFTIVELIIVTVVIGILAAVIVVSYSGISQKAVVSTMQSDLTHAKKQLLNFQVQSSTNSFPTAINCTNTTATEICIRLSSGNSVVNYSVYNNTSLPGFYLSIKNDSSGSTYHLTENSNPSTLNTMVTNNLLLNLDAGNTVSYAGTGSTWNDLSGNNFNVALTSTAFSSLNSGSLTFDGVSSSGQINNPPNNALDLGTSDFSLRVVLKANSSATGWRFIFQKGTSGAPGYGFHTFNNILVASIQATGGTNQHSNFNTLTVGQWYDCTFVFKRNESIFGYCNGASTGTASYQAGNTGSINTTHNLNIGSWIGTSNFFHGQIAIVQIYNRALSQSEVLQNFNATRDRYGL